MTTMKRLEWIIRFLLGQLAEKLVILGECGASKTILIAALYKLLNEPGGSAGSRVLMGPADRQIAENVKRIERGFYPLKTPAGRKNSFLVKPQGCPWLHVIEMAGEWLAQPETLDGAALWSKLRDCLVLVPVNAFAVDDVVAEKAIRGMTSTYQDDRLAHKLPDAARAAMFVLHGIDIAQDVQVEQDGTDEAYFLRRDAIQVLQATYAVLQRYQEVVLRPTAGGRGFEYVIGTLVVGSSGVTAVTGGAAAPDQAAQAQAVAAELDGCFRNLTQYALAQYIHLPVLRRLIRETPDVLVVLTHCDLIHHTPGLSHADLERVFDTLIGPDREVYRHQLLCIGNLEIMLQPRTAKHPTRLIGFDLSGARAVWNAVLLTLRGRRRAWPWSVMGAHLPGALLLSLAAALCGTRLLGWTSAGALTWMLFAAAAAAGLLGVEYLHRHGGRLLDRLFAPDLFPEPGVQPAVAEPAAVAELPAFTNRPPAVTSVEEMERKAGTTKAAGERPVPNPAGNGERTPVKRG
jgi:hypothetical protein